MIRLFLCLFIPATNTPRSLHNIRTILRLLFQKSLFYSDIDHYGRTKQNAGSDGR